MNNEPEKQPPISNEFVAEGCEQFGDQREYIRTLPGGLKLYKVKLVGGTFDGVESVCTHNTVIMNGERYLRGADDSYHYTPDGTGKN